MTPRDAPPSGGAFMCGFYGRRVTRDLAEMIDRYRVSAFVLYDERNIASAGQLRRLADEIRRRCGAAGLGRPLLAVDHEGGVNSQLRRAGATFPGNLAMAAGGSAESVREVGRRIGADFRRAGVNLNLAPVVDLFDHRNPGIGVRSFGADPGAVSKLAAAYLNGLLESGVLGAAKHFPGNSECRRDPHRGFARVGKPFGRLWREDLVPYRSLVRNGLPAVLTSHAVYPGLDRRRPATLSPAAMTGLLRRRLSFRGIAISDDLEMAAIERRYGLERAVRLALLAGVDLVMLCHTPGKMRRAVRHLDLARRESPRIERRVREAARRRNRVFRLFRSGVPRRPEDGLADRLAEAAVTILRDRDGLVPIRPERGRRLGVVNPLHTMYGWNREVRLDAAFRRRHPGTVGTLFDPGDPAGSMRRVLSVARRSDVIVAGTYDAYFSAPQVAMIRRLASLRRPLAVVATRGPQDLLRMRFVRTYVAAYNFYDVSLRAVARVMTGASPVRGRLPVRLPGIALESR